MALQRADIRAKYNLQGSCLVDIATACCCGCCDLIQQDKEVAHREPLQQAATQQPYKGGEEMTFPAQQ